MELNRILKELEKLGYTGFIRGGKGDEKYIFCGVFSEKTLFEPNSLFHIFVKENLMILQHFEGQIIEEREYKSLEMLIDSLNRIK